MCEIIEFPPNNDNRKRPKKDWHMHRCDLYYLDHFRRSPVSTRCAMLQCIVCGEIDVYVFPLPDGADQLFCRVCQSQGLHEK